MSAPPGSKTLGNAKHERFAQAVVSGRSFNEAYAEVGYVLNPSHARRLGANPTVKERIAFLLAKAAERAIVSAETIGLQLDEDRAFAIKCEVPSAAVSATMGKAKLFGLLAERVEHTGKDGAPIEVHEISDEEAARRMLFVIAKARKQRGQTIQ